MFLKACEEFGRHNIEDIADEIPNKTIREVKDYSEVFWMRYKELYEDIPTLKKKITSIKKTEVKK